MSSQDAHTSDENACICGADEPCVTRCERHDRTLHGYPCGPCQDEWAEEHPRTSAAISKIAAGKGGNGALAVARRADATAHAEPCRWGCVTTPPGPTGGEPGC